MKIKLYNLETSSKTKQLFQKKIDKLIKTSDWILGDEVEQFENNLKSYIGSKYALGVNSGTDALEISLRALNIKKGDEVIVPAYSFFATSEVVLKLDATPVYSDISKKDLNLNISEIKKLITKKTKAVIPVHLFGNPVNMIDLKNEINDNRIFIVEDVAQAFGSSLDNKMLGNHGTTGCFSFYPTKNLGDFGDAGAITTNNKKLYEKMLILRNHGQKKRYYHTEIGYNSRLDNIQAAILNIKIQQIKEIETQKVKNINYYYNLLSDESTVKILGSKNQPLNQLPIEFKIRKKLINVKKKLEINNIEYGKYYPYGLHEFKISKHNTNNILENIDWAKKSTITLPCHEELKLSDIEKICEIIKKS